MNPISESEMDSSPSKLSPSTSEMGLIEKLKKSKMQKVELKNQLLILTSERNSLKKRNDKLMEFTRKIADASGYDSIRNAECEIDSIYKHVENQLGELKGKRKSASSVLNEQSELGESGNHSRVKNPCIKKRRTEVIPSSSSSNDGSENVVMSPVASIGNTPNKVDTPLRRSRRFLSSSSYAKKSEPLDNTRLDVNDDRGIPQASSSKGKTGRKSGRGMRGKAVLASSTTREDWKRELVASLLPSTYWHQQSSPPEVNSNETIVITSTDSGSD